jgi:hypothetical protein
MVPGELGERCEEYAFDGRLIVVVPKGTVYWFTIKATEVLV